MLMLNMEFILLVRQDSDLWKKFGYQAFDEDTADYIIFAYIFEIWNKKIGVSDVNFEIVEYPNFSEKTRLILFRLL